MNIRDYLTDIEAEIYEIYQETGSHRKTAERVGKCKSTVTDTMKRVNRKLAVQGHSPEHDMTHMVPDGYHVKGTSTLYDEDGKPRLQWVKSNIDHERQQELMQAVIEELKKDIPRIAPTPPPKNKPNQLLNCYVITDFHIGMMGWGEETGDDDWDTKIAEEMLMAWFDRAIDLAPDSKACVFAQIGDFLHWDGFDAVTPASKHLLDADTRFQRLVRVSIRLIRYCIERLRAKHETVYIIMADANHDPAGEAWLREWLSVFYEDEPRVVVDTTADSYYCHEFGATSLFFHHGHKRKPNNIDDVFVAKFRKVFGRTKYSYAHMGHLHHLESKETNLMVVEQHRTLAAKDAYAGRGGYMSGRDAQVITYHKDYGEVSRIKLSADMLKS